MKIIQSEGRDPKEVAKEFFESEEAEGFNQINVQEPNGVIHEIDREDVPGVQSGDSEDGPE